MPSKTNNLINTKPSPEEQNLNDNGWLREILDMVSDGVICYNKKLNPVYSNEQAREYLSLFSSNKAQNGSKIRNPKLYFKDGKLVQLKNNPVYTSFKTSENLKNEIIEIKSKSATKWISISTQILKTDDKNRPVFVSLIIKNEKSAIQEIVDESDISEIIEDLPQTASFNCECDESQIFFTNNNIADITGFNIKHFSKDPSFYSRLIFDEYLLNVNHIRSSKNESKKYRIEYRLLGYRKKIIWVEETGKKIPYDNGKKLRIEGSLRDISDRKRIEDDYHLKNAALEAAANTIIITDKNGIIIWANKAFEKITGFSVEEIKGKNPRVLKSGTHDVTYYKYLWSTISKGDVWKGEIINKKKDGTLYCEEMTITPVKNNADKITHYVAVKQDVSERKKMLEALFESEIRFRTIFENSPMGIFQVDINGKPKVSNSAFNELLGYSEKELENKSVSDITHPDDREKSQILLKKLFERKIKKYNIEKRYIKKNGDIIWVDLAVTRMKDENNEDTSLGIFQDVTERKKTAEDLEIMNERLKLSISELKQTQRQLIDSEKMAALGQLIAGIGHEVNTPLAAIKASLGNLSESIEKTFEDLSLFQYKMTPGEFEILLVILNHFANYDNVLSSREARKLKREILGQLNKMELDERELIAEHLVYLNISDIDFIKPLFQNKNCKFILEAARNLLSIKKNSENIKNAVDKAAFIVFALKKYSYKENNSEKVELDIVDSLETVLVLYNNHFKHGVELDKNFDSVPKIKGYPDELNQVWTNLINNALYSMQYKGKLKIDLFERGNNIVVSICDSGDGIPEEVQSRIFDPFFTTKPKGEGSGLGLDIVKKIIDNHMGSITFESCSGKGTTFIIELPLHQEQH